MREPRTTTPEHAQLSPASTRPRHAHDGLRQAAPSSRVDLAQRVADQSAAARATATVQAMTKSSREATTGSDAVVQRAGPESGAPGGLPPALRRGAESLSGVPLGDVRVHRNSSEPAKVNAQAFAQGRDIHLGPGKEAHLPHEAWHVVQQRQGRVRATRQLKGEIGINDDPTLEREADVMGARAAQLGGATAPSTLQAKPSLVGSVPTGSAPEIAQLREETVQITGQTHLVHMRRERTTLFGGENGPVVQSGDLITIDRDVAYNSRRGPNQEVRKNRRGDRTGPQIYKYYLATDVNGNGVTAENLYLRDETFKRAQDDRYDQRKNALIAYKAQLAKLKADSGGVVDAMVRALDYADEHPAAIDFPQVGEGRDGAITQVRQGIQRPVPGQMGEAQAQYEGIQAILRQLNVRFEHDAHVARTAGDAAFGKYLVNVAEQAHALTAPAQNARAMPRGAPVANRADEISDAVDMMDVGQTTIHGLGGGILGAATLSAEGSAAAAFATGFGYVAGPLGILFGLIGVALGLRAAWNGYHREKELNRLIPRLDRADARRIAAYAAQQKGKKKWGGAITTTVGIAAIVGGAVGIAALSIASLGVGAAILGIGAALIGLGVVIGKIYNHFKKRRRWRENMAQLVLAAVDAEQTNAFPASLMQVGTRVAGTNAGSDQRKRGMAELMNACVAYADSKRELMANETVHELMHGTPGAKYEVSLILDALKLDPENVRQKAQTKGEKSAASLVARKLKSW